MSPKDEDCEVRPWLLDSGRATKIHTIFVLEDDSDIHEDVYYKAPSEPVNSTP